MKRLLALLLTVPLAGCLPFAIFEDVGTDPHPPELQLLGVAYQPVANSEGVTPAPQLLPPEGFVVRPNDVSANTLLFRVEYTDVGGDVQTILIRDRDGTLNVSATPAAPEVDIDGDGVVETLAAPEFLPGTSGLADVSDVLFDVTMRGPHRIEVWAEDSHGSRSPKVTFTVEVEI